MAGLLVMTVKPSLPLDVSITWNSKPLLADSPGSRLPRLEFEDEWSEIDHSAGRTTSRPHRPGADRQQDQRDRVHGWDEADQGLGDSARAQDDDWTESGRTVGTTPSLDHAPARGNDDRGRIDDWEQDEPPRRSSAGDGWADAEVDREPALASIREPGKTGEDGPGLGTRNDLSENSRAPVPKMDAALVRASAPSAEVSAQPSPTYGAIPRVPSRNAPVPEDPARFAQALQVLAVPQPELVSAPQPDPASVAAATVVPITTAAALPAAPGKTQTDPDRVAGNFTTNAPGPLSAAGTEADPAVDRVSCPSCGGSGRVSGGADTCLSCGGKGTCYPGQKACYSVEAKTGVGRFFANLYECLCCPDPCYQPSWIPEANAAFFVDYARPQTVTRFRYDALPHLEFPDRAEYWWAQSMYNYKGSFQGKGPQPPKLVGPRGNIVRGWSYVDMNIGSFYTEAAAKGASFFVEVPYESLNAYPKAPPQLGSAPFRHSAGFSDMNIGTKSLLLDCELLQLTFQFRSYFPIGNVGAGLGNGHVSLEPSLLTTVKLGPETYFQGQLAEWIPIGGDQAYTGSILKYGFSFNQVLYHCTPNVPVIGTFEMDGWTFQDGLYTNPFTGPSKASNESYFNIGPGLRMSICKRIDFGAAVTWPVTYHYWADPWVRTELRVFY